MVQDNNGTRVGVAWSALSGRVEQDGWRTIPLVMTGNCRLLAGRRYPGSEEAILIGFRRALVPGASKLPQGHGFGVERLERQIAGDAKVWIALSRISSGSQDIFTAMVEDIINYVERRAAEAEEIILYGFLDRIRAWQNFMDRGEIRLLSVEAEQGLYGELVVLRDVLEYHESKEEAVKAWGGPSGAEKDFLFGSYGIEVKTSVSQGTFPAKISSLQQLDDSSVKPLYIAGIRLILEAEGVTLPEMARLVAKSLQNEPSAMALYESKLISAGLIEAYSDRYFRRFRCAESFCILVDEKFPRLTPANVPGEIRKVVYELDLAMVRSERAALQDVMYKCRS